MFTNSVSFEGFTKMIYVPFRFLSKLQRNSLDGGLRT